MDEFKLCFFEELTESDGKCSHLLIFSEVHSIFLLDSLTSKDEHFARINAGKWIEILDDEAFKSFLATGNESFETNHKLGTAAACLLAFLQDNFTGPDLVDSEKFRFQSFDNKNQERWSTERISIDGIELNANIKSIPLLITSRNFLEDLLEQNPQDLVSAHLLRFDGS